ncbi:hypothetical protein PROFUN_01997 [Planoprotostelium fungivorum]|uniref:Glycosyl hydrolase family 13 catalytic domain-containing protein n=1 Tax=Planoprotostelium fungivorum TaxID=1890364 RepID=A0A2P6NB43_9EUKA|nr:hypothetical protein PROFUN_01997 [Planoprotostelium fungivorum]
MSDFEMTLAQTSKRQKALCHNPRDKHKTQNGVRPPDPLTFFYGRQENPPSRNLLYDRIHCDFFPPLLSGHCRSSFLWVQGFPGNTSVTAEVPGKSSSPSETRDLTPSNKMMRLIALLSFVVVCLCATTQEWKSRTIYQVLTDRFAKSTPGTAKCGDLTNYCGGSYKPLTDKLDYIKGMGFDAIWISPIVHNIARGYHGYWQDDLTRLNEHFGNEADLMEFISKAHSKGIWVMVDVVANHMIGDSFPKIAPFNKPEHYHSCAVCPQSCNIEDWSNQFQVENCRLANLYDLNQTNPYVRDTLNNWIKGIVQKYKFDGVRIDTLVEVEKSFCLYHRTDFVQASGVFAIGEASNYDIQYVSAYQTPKGTMPSVLSYPLYYTLINVFAMGHSMNQLKDRFNDYHASFGDVDVLGTFLDCHDVPRFLSFNRDYKLYENGLVTVLFSSGIPIIYYGTEQYLDGGHEPNNREDMWRTGYNTNVKMYNYIKTMNAVRSRAQVWKHTQVERYVDDNVFVFTRGDALIATTNVGSNGPMLNRTVTFHPFKEGDTLCNVFFWMTDCIKVINGVLPITLVHGEAKVFLPSRMGPVLSQIV